MELEKEFVPYDLALELKGLGFDKPYLAKIDQTDYLHINGTKRLPRGSMMYDTIDCPTFSQAFRWFREKYNFCSWVYQVDNGKYFFSILEEGRYLDTNNKKRNSYEEAEKECLKKLIEIVKERK